MEKVKIMSASHGDCWNVIYIDGEYEVPLKRGVKYVEAYRAKKEADKRIDAGQLAAPRKPLITI